MAALYLPLLLASEWHLWTLLHYDDHDHKFDCNQRPLIKKEDLQMILYVAFALVVNSEMKWGKV